MLRSCGAILLWVDWGTSREHGTDGVFVLREVALDFGQIERGKDARVWFAFKEKLEGFLDQFLWSDCTAGEFQPVFGTYRDRVRGGCLVPDGDLEGRLVHLFDGDGHGYYAQTSSNRCWPERLSPDRLRTAAIVTIEP